MLVSPDLIMVIPQDAMYTSNQDLPLVVEAKVLAKDETVIFNGRSQRVLYVERGKLKATLAQDNEVILEKGDILTVYDAMKLFAIEDSFVVLVAEGKVNLLESSLLDSRIIPDLAQRPMTAPQGIQPPKLIIDNKNNLSAVVYRGVNDYPAKMLPITINSGAICIGVKLANGLEALHKEPDNYMEILIIREGSTELTVTDTEWSNAQTRTITSGEKVIVYPSTGHSFVHNDAKMIVIMQGPFTGKPKIKEEYILKLIEDLRSGMYIEDGCSRLDAARELSSYRDLRAIPVFIELLLEIYPAELSEEVAPNALKDMWDRYGPYLNDEQGYLLAYGLLLSFLSQGEAYLPALIEARNRGFVLEDVFARAVIGRALYPLSNIKVSRVYYHGKTYILPVRNRHFLKSSFFQTVKRV